MLSLWAVAAILSQWILYLGILGASGTVVCTLFFRLEDTRRLTALFSALGLFAAVVGFALKGAALTGDASGLTDPDMLGLLWITANGTSLSLQLIGFALLALGLPFGKPGQIASLSGAALVISSLTTVGHFAESTSALLPVLLYLHLLLAAVWIGILIPLRRLASDPSRTGDTAQLGHRFGQVAAIFVPVLVLAGCIMGYVLIGSVSDLFLSGYGRMLLFKTSLVSALLLLAARNKTRYVPRLQAGDITAASSLATSIRMEWYVILGILAATATLTSQLTPPS